MIGIIGSTGCGKTTLVSMIPRLYDVDEGKVLVDGIDVRDYSLNHLREGVGMVLQKNVLFSGTIEENLQWGDENAAKDQIREAAESAQAEGFIQKLADGYETEIINGITSFTAAAARLNTDLVEKDQPLHVIPASYRKDSVPELLALPGTKILMKAGKEMKAVRAAILTSGQEAVMVENCGMEGEKIYANPAEIPDDASYYSVIIVKEKQEEQA